MRKTINQRAWLFVLPVVGAIADEVFHMDPGPAVVWGEMVEAAKLVRTILRDAGLDAWLKTTGGKGLHVVVPILPQHDWSVCLDVARAFAIVLLVLMTAGVVLSAFFLVTTLSRGTTRAGAGPWRCGRLRCCRA